MRRSLPRCQQERPEPLALLHRTCAEQHRDGNPDRANRAATGSTAMSETAIRTCEACLGSSSIVEGVVMWADEFGRPRSPFWVSTGNRHYWLAALAQDPAEGLRDTAGTHDSNRRAVVCHAFIE